jgi:hypothetical protein
MQAMTTIRLLSTLKKDSSEEIVGGFRFRQLAKRVIEGEFEASEGAKYLFTNLNRG